MNVPKVHRPIKNHIYYFGRVIVQLFTNQDNWIFNQWVGRREKRMPLPAMRDVRTIDQETHQCGDIGLVYHFNVAGKEI